MVCWSWLFCSRCIEFSALKHRFFCFQSNCCVYRFDVAFAGYLSLVCLGLLKRMLVFGTTYETCVRTSNFCVGAIGQFTIVYKNYCTIRFRLDAVVYPRTTISTNSTQMLGSPIKVSKTKIGGIALTPAGVRSLGSSFFCVWETFKKRN